MSNELKAIFGYTSNEVETVNSRAEGDEFYFKSDVDAVLAEKDAEIARLKAELEDVRNTYKESVEVKGKIWERCKKAEADASETLALLEERNKQVGELQSKVTLASLAEDCSNLRHKRCNYCSALHHHKYKRCLAQAQRCMDAHIETEADAAFFTRWEHRWLTLADKFKEAK